jgi:predicted site-specific integrase-resolvase
MKRGKYRDELIRSVLGATSTSPLGIRLARVCVEANLPAAYVAQVFGVSRMALHLWFRGGNIRPAKVDRISVFTQLIQEDLRNGRLPVSTLEAARAYLQEMTDAPIKQVSQKKAD